MSERRYQVTQIVTRTLIDAEINPGEAVRFAKLIAERKIWEAMAERETSTIMGRITHEVSDLEDTELWDPISPFPTFKPNDVVVRSFVDISTE